MSTTNENVTDKRSETEEIIADENELSSSARIWGVDPICRLCLSRQKPTRCILSESVLLHKLRVCLPLKISETDKLPKEICETCSTKITDIYDYYNSARLAEKKLLSLLNKFSNINSTAFSSETDKIFKIGSLDDSIRNFDNCLLELNIKQEPVESANDDLFTSYNSVHNRNQLGFSKHTQTDDNLFTLENIVHGDIYSRDGEKILVKEEFMQECALSSPEESNVFDSSHENDYSSEDNITLNKILKIPPIKVKIKKEYVEVKKNKRGRKRKHELSTKKLKTKSQESLYKKKLKYNNDDKINKVSGENYESEIKIENSELKLENGLNKDDKNWLNPEVSINDSNLWQCLTCFIFKKSRADLLQHYKDHVEYPEKFVQNLTIESKDDDKGLIKKETGSDDKLNLTKISGRKLNFTYIPAVENGGVPGYQCLKCRKIYKNKRSLTRHQICHNDARPYPCNMCGRSYKRAYEILLHGRAHNGIKTLFCQYDQCNYSTVYPGALFTHQKRHAPDFKYTCEICNKGFDVLTWFEEHKNFHTGDKPFSCDICNKKFIYSRYLASHRKTVHPETIARKISHRCNECQTEFQYRKQLLRHINRVHNAHGSASVLCHVCGKGLSSKEHLKFHNRIHTGEKPHICRTCGKGFAKKCNLVLHERVHSGEKPHICSHCGKGFAQRSTLVIHERYHSGARPYVCLACNKGFVAKGLLSMHQKTCILP